MSEEFQVEVIQMLMPKIRSVLYQTDIKHREELEQEIVLIVISDLKTKKFNDVPNFFELLKDEKVVVSI